MHRLVHENGVITYTFENLAAYPVSAHVSTRHGGVSPAPWNSLNFSVKRGDSGERVRANRQRLADALRIEATSFVFCQQVHGSRVERVVRDDAGAVRLDADGLLTADAMTPLSLVFADCVPVALYDRRRHVLAVCHAGWRGTVAGIAADTVAAMRSAFDTDPADIVAGIGPSIGPDSYEVGTDVVTAAERLPDADRLFRFRNGSGRNPHFDLWEANRSQLVQAGVPESQIEVSGIDTARNTADFFSHRAEHGQCGLFSMVAWLHEA